MANRLEYSGVILAHYNLRLLGSSDSSTLASRVAGIAGVCHQTWLIFVFIVETWFHHDGQAGLELLAPSDLPSLISQNAGITGVSHHAQPEILHKAVTVNLKILNSDLATAPLKTLEWIPISLKSCAKTKVRKFHMALAVQKKVVWFDVSVDESKL
ncbi:hypothetical protein AAY473_004869, partial [Plecturocebus cupreus]